MDGSDPPRILIAFCAKASSSSAFAAFIASKNQPILTYGRANSHKMFNLATARLTTTSNFPISFIKSWSSARAEIAVKLSRASKFFESLTKLIFFCVLSMAIICKYHRYVWNDSLFFLAYNNHRLQILYLLRFYEYPELSFQKTLNHLNFCY